VISKLFNSKFFSIAVVFIAGWLVLSWLGVENNKKAFDKEIMGIEAKISNVQKTNNELSEFLSHFDNPSFLEKEARLKLNYKAPDEEVIFVYRDNGAKTASISANASDGRLFKHIFSKLAGFKNKLLNLNE